MAFFSKTSEKLMLVLFIVCYFLFPSGIIFSRAEIKDLRAQIEEKAKQLQEIEAQRDIIEKNLEEIEKSKNSLKKEISIIDSNINQLNLLIKGNKLNIEKLDLEINSLEEEIDKLGTDISTRRVILQKLFTELQEKDRENFFIIFLKNKSLSQAVDEVRSIERLNNFLTKSIAELNFLQSGLVDKLNVAQSKKRAKEIETVNLKIRQQIVQEQRQLQQTLLNQTRNQEKIYAAQLTEIEKLQAAVSAEVEKIEAELRKTINPNLLPLPRPFVLLKPLPEPYASRKLSQGYGFTPAASRLYKGKYHNGVDFAAPVGTEVLAAEEGMVINVGNQDKFCYKGSYGKFVVVKHNNGLTTLYGHLSKYIVSIGQRVERGEVIGYVGSTGYATGPHLHFTVFASQTLVPARPGYPEGTKPSKSCGPMPVGGDLDPTKYF